MRRISDIAGTPLDRGHAPSIANSRVDHAPAPDPCPHRDEWIAPTGNDPLQLALCGVFVPRSMKRSGGDARVIRLTLARQPDGVDQDLNMKPS
jgi:hypothetical protein